MYIACTSQILHHHPGFDTEVVSVVRCLTLSSIITNYTRNHFLTHRAVNCTGNHHKSRHCKAVARGGGGATGACAPPFSKKKSTFSEKIQHE